MASVLIPLSQLLPAAYNPRKDLQPGDAEYEKLKRSIEEFGMVEPLIYNRRTGRLVGGHQRLKVLQASGVTEVEVSVVDLDDDRERALNLALNKVQGDWDQEKLAQLLAELDEHGFDLAITGFDPGEIDELLGDQGSTGDASAQDEDDLPPPPTEPITRPGDLIELGEHLLLCGDAKRGDPAAAEGAQDRSRCHQPAV